MRYGLFVSRLAASALPSILALTLPLPILDPHGLVDLGPCARKPEPFGLEASKTLPNSVFQIQHPNKMTAPTAVLTISSVQTKYSTIQAEGRDESSEHWGM